MAAAASVSTSESEANAKTVKRSGRRQQKATSKKNGRRNRKEEGGVVRQATRARRECANSREMQEGFEHTRALGRYVGQYLPHRLLPERPTSQEIDPQGTRGPNRAKWVHARALRSSVQLLKIACAHPLTSMIPVDYSG